MKNLIGKKGKVVASGILGFFVGFGLFYFIKIVLY